MIQRFILSLSFFAVLSTSLKATNLYFFDGLDAFVQEKLSTKGYSSALYYSPSLRFSDGGRIQNGRFVGNYGKWKPEFPVHFQTISFDFDDDGLDFFPQNPISAILQILFPSPGGIELQPNQTISDPITLVSFKTLGIMLRHIEEDCMIPEVAKREETLRNSLYHLFPLETAEDKASQFDISVLNLKECMKYYDTFLAYDFKKNLALYIVRLLSGVSDEDLEGEDFTQDDPDKYTKALKSVDIDLFERGLLKDGELETYIHYWDTYNKLKTYNHNKLTPAQERELRKFKETYKDYLLLEENKNRFKKVVLVETLIQALSQQNNDQENYSYPPSIVQRTLITYFWMKAKNEADVIDWFSGLLEAPTEELMPRIKSRFPLTHYESWKTKVLEQSQEGKEILLNPEKLALLSWGYKLFDAVLPPFIPYGVAKYKGKPFANCVETSCVDLLRVISRRKGEQGYQQDIMVFPPTSLAYKIFEHHSDPATHFSPEVRDNWATMLSAREGLIYCKPETAKREKRNYELKSGVINILNCLTLLLSDSLEKVSFIKFEDGVEAIEDAIEELNQYCSQEGFIFKAELDDKPLKAEDLKDYFGDIIFTINGKKSFTWHITKMHSDIEVCEDEENDWRKTVSTENFLSTPILKEISPQFLSLDFLREKFSRLSLSERSSLCYGMDVKPLKTKLGLIELIFRNQLTSLENFASSLMMLIVNLEDYYPKKQLFMLLISLSTGDQPVLTDEQMNNIISRHPSLMTTGISTEEFGHIDAAIWAYKNNKKEWIKLAASYIRGLNVLEEPTDYEDFISTFSQLKNLRHLNLHNILKNPDIYKIFPLLTSLENLTVTINSSDDISKILDVFNYLPSTFKQFNCYGFLYEDEFCKMIQAFFTKIPTGKLKYSFWNSYDKEPQNLTEAIERLQAFAADKGISQEQLKLSHQ